MYLSRSVYSGNGSTTVFAVGFPYLSKDHLQVTVNGLSLVASQYSWISASSLSFASPPSAGVSNIDIRRVTPRVSAEVVFRDASTLTESDLNTENTQLLYILQEVIDDNQSRLGQDFFNNWNALGKRITNVGAPQLGTDAATLGWVEGYTASLVLTGVGSPVVGNISAIRALNKSTVSNVLSSGYYAPGDGGGGPYYCDYADVVSADNGGTVIVASDGGRWKLQVTAGVSIKQFGAKGDGTTDDTGAIQAALNGTRGNLAFPAGKFRVSGTLQLNSGNNIVGAGRSVATLLQSNLTANTLLLDGVSHCYIHDIGFDSTSQQTDGAYVLIQNCHGIRVSEFLVSANSSVGVKILAGANQYMTYIDHFEINGGYNAILIGDDGTTTSGTYVGLVQDTWISQGEIAHTTGAGILLRNASGIMMDSVDIINSSSHGLQTYPGQHGAVLGLWASKVQCDTGLAHGWDLTTNGGTVAHFNLTSCWGASNGNGNSAYDGLHIEQGTGQLHAVTVIGGQFINNSGNGISAVSGDNCTFLGVDALNNGNSGATKSGIEIGIALVNYTITGGRCGNNSVFGATASQSYGITIDQPETGNPNASITAVNLLGNTVKPVNANLYAPYGRFVNCPGLITENRGGAQINSGTSSATITHGLAFTPTAANITLSKTSLFVGASDWFIDSSSITATQFTVKLNANTTSTFYFDWQAGI